MTVCANRSDSPGFFTSCVTANSGPCVCGVQVAAELKAAAPVEEIERELLGMTRGGYLLDSDYGKRDTFHVTGGRGTRVLEHTNPEMTPERYDAELDAWWQARKAERAHVKDGA